MTTTTAAIPEHADQHDLKLQKMGKLSLDWEISFSATREVIRGNQLFIGGRKGWRRLGLIAKIAKQVVAVQCPWVALHCYFQTDKESTMHGSMPLSPLIHILSGLW